MKSKALLLLLASMYVYFLFTSQPIWAGTLTFEQAYKILGVSPTASESQIKRAYQKLAMKYHPDRNSEPNAAELFKQAKESYDLLRGEKPEANNSIYGRYADIVNIYNLEYFDASDGKKKVPSEDILLDIYSRHYQIKLLLSKYFSSATQDHASDKSLWISFEGVLGQLQSIANSEKHPRIKTERMVAVISSALSDQYGPEVIDQFLSGYVKTIRTTERLKAFIVDSSIFRNTRATKNPFEKISIDPVRLYPYTLSQIYSAPTKELLNEFLHKALVNDIFNQGIFENNFKYLSDLVRKANNRNLWDAIVANLAIKDLKSSASKLNLNPDTIGFLIESLDNGVHNETKIGIYFSIAKLNPQLFVQYPKLFSGLLDISDYTKFAEDGVGFFKTPLREFILNSSDPTYQKFVNSFMARFLDRDPQLAQKILTQNISEIDSHIQSLVQSFGPQNVSKEYLNSLNLQKRTLEHYYRLPEAGSSCEKLFLK